MVCLETYQPVDWLWFFFLVLWLQGSRNRREAVVFLTPDAMTIRWRELSFSSVRIGGNSRITTCLLFFLGFFFYGIHISHVYMLLASRWRSCIDFCLCFCVGCQGYKGNFIQGPENTRSHVCWSPEEAQHAGGNTNNHLTGSAQSVIVVCSSWAEFLWASSECLYFLLLLTQMSCNIYP